MAMPTGKTIPSSTLDKYLMLLYSPPKTGKTVLAASFPDAVFLATEPGQKFISVSMMYDRVLQNWNEFYQAAIELVDDNCKTYKTIVIDTVDNLYRFCLAHICKAHGIDSPGDMGHGKGWDLLKTELTRPILRLATVGYGIIFISHSKEIQIDIKGKDKYTKISPTMSEACRKLVLPLSDIIGYLTKEVVRDNSGDILSEPRVLVTEPSPSLEVGARGGPNFKFPPRIVIPENTSGYDAIAKAVVEYNRK